MKLWAGSGGEFDWSALGIGMPVEVRIHALCGQNVCQVYLRVA